MLPFSVQFMLAVAAIAICFCLTPQIELINTRALKCQKSSEKYHQTTSLYAITGTLALAFKSRNFFVCNGTTLNSTHLLSQWLKKGNHRLQITYLLSILMFENLKMFSYYKLLSLSFSLVQLQSQLRATIMRQTTRQRMLPLSDLLILRAKVIKCEKQDECGGDNNRKRTQVLIRSAQLGFAQISLMSSSAASKRIERIILLK